MSFSFFIHVFLFFVLSFLIATYILSKITGDSEAVMSKRLALVYWLVILPPVLDAFVFHRGSVYRYPGRSYVSATRIHSQWYFNNPVSDLLTFYWTNPSPGKGILLVGMAFMLLAAIYSYWRTRNPLKTLVSVATVWLMYYFMGGFPYFFPYFIDLSGGIDGYAYYTYIFAYLSTIVLALIYLDAGVFSRASVYLLPVFHSVFMVTIGALLSHPGIFLFISAFIVAVSLGLFATDYFFETIPKKMSSKLSQVSPIFLLPTLINVLPLASSSFVPSLLAASFIFLVVLYSHPKLRLKNHFIFSASAIGLGSVILLLLGATLGPAALPAHVIQLCVVIFFAGILGAAAKDFGGGAIDKGSIIKTPMVISALVFFPYFMGFVLIRDINVLLLSLLAATLTVDALLEYNEKSCIKIYSIYSIYLLFVIYKLI